MKSIKEKRGITLIALVVTIIVILILAGVTIDVTLGENGILNKSKEAADRMNSLVKEDEAELNELLDELNETMDNNWNSNIEIPEENTTPEPDPEPEVPKIEDATDIQGETVQVEDEYGNKVTVPKGFGIVEEEGTTVPEGIVVQDKDGNQFVWIPVGRVYKDNTRTNYSDIQLGRYSFDRTNGTPTVVQAAYTEENIYNYERLEKINSYYQEYSVRDDPEGTSDSKGKNAIAKDLEGFVNSVKSNGGYYLARYEASYGSGNNVSNYKPLSKVSTKVMSNSSTPLTEGTLWCYIKQIDAAKIGRNMYNNDESVGVESDLVNSYAWDTAIVFIQEMGVTNYANKTSVNSNLINTGKTGDKACNIFDMASNLAEWTTENSTNKGDGTRYNCCTFRGDNYRYGQSYTADRNSDNAGYCFSTDYTNFRIVAYIK